MKRNYINNAIILFFLFFLSSCQIKEVQQEQAPPSDSLMNLNKHLNHQLTTIRATGGFHLFPVQINGEVQYDNRKKHMISSRVKGRIENLYLRYNFQPVKKGELLMEIYAPELVAGQRELLLLDNKQEAPLYQAALNKLLFLGMDKATILQVLRTKKVQYLVPVYSSVNGYIQEQQAEDQFFSETPSTTNEVSDGMSGMQNTNTPESTSFAPSNQNTPILLRQGQYVSKGQTLFSVYTNKEKIASFAFNPTIAPTVEIGKKLLFGPQEQPSICYEASIGLIEPVYRAGQTFSVGRVYLPENSLRIGQLLHGSIAMSTDQGWWLPESAVLFTGLDKQAIVFKKNQEEFEPLTIQTGLRINGLVQVLSDIHDWDIIKEAEFLMDSEGFIQAKTDH